MSSHSPKPVALIVGASRGIGRQVAIDLSKYYSVVVAAKSTSDASTSVPFPPDPNSPQSTISTVEREIRAAGGVATAVAVDVRSTESIEALVARTIVTYGRLDVLVYNAGAIYWAPVSATPTRRFRLMQLVNPEGLYAAVQAALPHLRASGAGGLVGRGRIVVVSPPIYSRFFRGKTAYAVGKVGMSVLTMGLGMDFERERREGKEGEGRGMAVTSIWPAVSIESAATSQFTATDPTNERDLRKPTIFSDAILAILRSPVELVNGLLAVDEDFLREHAGVTDFDKYSVVPGATPRRIMPAKFPDLRVEEQDDEGKRTDSRTLKGAKL